VAALDDALPQPAIAVGEHQADLNVGPESVGQGEHSLEVPEADAAAAVGGEQRSRVHDATALAAAHAWIRWSARTTSS
jgi:hypothetical protein